jgi:hypothetical protein
LIEFAVAIGLTSCLILALTPQARGHLRARGGLVGASAHRSALSARTLRDSRLIPVLGGPARMPRFLPQMAYSGADQLDANVIDFPAPVPAVATGASRRRSTRPAAAASNRRGAELAAVAPAPAARANTRSASRRATRQIEAVTH